MPREDDSRSARERQLSETIDKKERRRLRAERERSRSMWFGLGMFGLFGWSVTVPTLIGIAVGIWIDGTWPSRFSWTLMCLFMGVVVGCLNAWYWVKRESETK